MLAYFLNRYGGPDGAKLQEAPEPVPRTGEVLVRVHAAGLNPIDYKIRGGAMKSAIRLSLPHILGSEVAGEVVALGKDSKGFAVGDRVFACQATGRLATFAAFVSIPCAQLAKSPKSIDLVTAAGVPFAGLTALQALRDELHVSPNQHVFIAGGAGGVGTFAIQIAKWLGAKVSTTASPRGTELTRSLGADEVIDYTSRPFEKALREVDAGLDLIGGDTLEKMLGVVKRRGSVVSVAGTPEPRTATKDLGGNRILSILFWFMSYGLRKQARRAGVDYRFLVMHPRGDELAELAALIDSNALRVVVDRVFPFTEIEQAIAYLEAGHAKGKVIVRMI